MRIILSLMLIVLSISLPAQDKKAKKILDKVNQRYEEFHSMEIEFKLKLEFPDREEQNQEGVLIQSGKNFFFSTDEQAMYGDGTDVWLFLKERNEVQINNYEDDADELSILTPKDLLKQYKSGMFDYSLVNQDRGIAQIEFKPLDENSDYSKFRLSINESKDEIIFVLGFGKDASRIHFEITGLKSNKSYPDSVFRFDPSKYPGVLVEDLRID